MCHMYLYINAVCLIDKIDVRSLCAVWKSLLFAVHQKVFSFFLMNIEKYVDITRTLTNLNDSMVHDAMRLQNVFNITIIQCKVKWSGVKSAFVKRNDATPQSHCNGQHKIFTQIDSQIENQFHFHKTIFICVHSHLSLDAEWNLQPQRHSQEQAAFDDYSQWQSTPYLWLSQKKLTFPIELMMWMNPRLYSI